MGGEIDKRMLYEASLMSQKVKNLPAIPATPVLSLGHEDSLEKEVATTPVFLPGKSHGQRSLEGYSPWVRKGLDTTEQLTLALSIGVEKDRQMRWQAGSTEVRK